MQQFTLSLDDPQDITSRLELTPEREQRLIALMAGGRIAAYLDVSESCVPALPEVRGMRLTP